MVEFKQFFLLMETKSPPRSERQITISLPFGGFLLLSCSLYLRLPHNLNIDGTSQNNRMSMSMLKKLHLIVMTIK